MAVFFTGQEFPAEFMNDVITFLFRLHACEADAATDALVVTQDTR